MFAGIVEGVGKVVSVRRASGADGGTRLDVDLGPQSDGVIYGASIAVNGVCLTVAELRGSVAAFDVIPETMRRSNLGELRSGSRVNLERSLRVGDRIDGHFVQGHIDGVGQVASVRQSGDDWRLSVSLDDAVRPFVVPKGSIAIDGVSLTVAEVGDAAFTVAIIPTTLKQTVLGDRDRGDRVNLETDILARIIVNRLDAHLAGRRQGGVTYETLRESGFLT